MDFEPLESAPEGQFRLGFEKTVQSALCHPYDVYGEQNAWPMEGSWALHRPRGCRRQRSGVVNDIWRRHQDLPPEPGKVLARWQTEGDTRLWKLIVSPEFGGARIWIA
jgi:hypothetical protein